MSRVRTTNWARRSPACEADDHDRCHHIVARGFHLWPTPGPHGYLSLCPCDCHDHCPLATGQIDDEETLQLACTCFDHGPALQRAHEHQAQLQRQHEALMAAAQNLSSDLDRDQVRQALQDATTTQGFTVPDQVLDYHADMIMAGRRHDHGLSALRTTFGHFWGVGQELWREGRRGRPNNHH